MNSMYTDQVLWQRMVSRHMGVHTVSHPSDKVLTHEERLALIHAPLPIVRVLPTHGMKGNCGSYVTPGGSGGFVNPAIPYAEEGR